MDLLARFYGAILAYLLGMTALFLIVTFWELAIIAGITIAAICILAPSKRVTR